MATNKITDSVGKKIVDALKMQDTDMISEPAEASKEVENFDKASENPFDSEFSMDNTTQEAENFNTSFNYQNSSAIDNAFQQSLIQNLGASVIAEVQDDFDYPQNVAVLRQLIGKLPAGVSKQTGAIIIKQTMEALGISMKSVLQDAQQVQENLKVSARECQASIQEYKKQIMTLEKQSQSYQKQYSALNDLISLFIQTTK